MDGRIPMQLSRGCIVVSIQLDMTSDVIARLQTDLLKLVSDSGASGVILDVSGVFAMDLEEFEALRKVMSMVEVMGARTVLSGMRPGIVSALVDLDADIGGIEAAQVLDHAFKLLGARNGPDRIRGKRAGN